jgi:hypothetical protein
MRLIMYNDSHATQRTTKHCQVTKALCSIAAYTALRHALVCVYVHTQRHAQTSLPAQHTAQTTYVAHVPHCAQHTSGCGAACKLC